MEYLIIIGALIAFFGMTDNFGKTDATNIVEEYKSDSMSMYWERLRTGKENRLKHMNLEEYTAHKKGSLND